MNPEIEEQPVVFVKCPPGECDWFETESDLEIPHPALVCKRCWDVVDLTLDKDPREGAKN